MIVLYFSCNFDVSVWGGELCFPTLPSWPEVPPQVRIVLLLGLPLKGQILKFIAKCLFTVFITNFLLHLLWSVLLLIFTVYISAAWYLCHAGSLFITHYGMTCVSGPANCSTYFQRVHFCSYFLKSTIIGPLCYFPYVFLLCRETCTPLQFLPLLSYTSYLQRLKHELAMFT